VDEKSIEFHNRRGDFERWAEYSLRDQVLAQQLRTIKTLNNKGMLLRKALAQIAQKRFVKLNKQVNKTLMPF